MPGDDGGEPMFQPVTLGALTLSNRIVMSPMTRSRAIAGDLPTDLHARYYGQRASAGLIVTEGAHPSADGKGYCRTPGIFSAAQVAAWRPVTEAVHARGGRIVLQLMHAGRIASRLNKDPGAETVAPSALAARGRIFTDSAGPVDYDQPRALTTAEVLGTIDDFAAGARNAVLAGFDGVELHGTGGYLAAQFLATGANRRTDRYGGTARNRARFVVETLEAMAAAVGADRVGLKIGPGNRLNDLIDDAPQETFGALLDAVRPMALAYLHVMRVLGGPVDVPALVGAHYDGPVILNEGYDFAAASAAVAAGLGSAVSFGQPFLANPDLPARFRRGAPLADFDRDTLYAAGPQGYVDYPAMAG